MIDSTACTSAVEVTECLSQQISELELLRSMYPNPDEIRMIDKTVVDSILKFINHTSDDIPPHLDFVLIVVIRQTLKLEICVDLPSLYPKYPPDVSVRCNQLSRQQETILNNRLANYIQEIPRGESCLYTIVSWIQDEAHIIESDMKNAINEKVNKEVKRENFARYWIYSHHIYNKRKREAILSNAKELKLNGFSLPGKPGIVCIEGEESNCKEWWRIIKGMTWQKIMLKRTEVFDPDEKNKQAKFNKFEEMHFENAMSSFSKYMDQMGFSSVFNEIFGFSGDIS